MEFAPPRLTGTVASVGLSAVEVPDPEAMEAFGLGDDALFELDDDGDDALFELDDGDDALFELDDDDGLFELDDDVGVGAFVAEVVLTLGTAP
jgi:hypothetical protein